MATVQHIPKSWYMNVGSGQLFIGLVQPPCFIVWTVSETECSSIANSDSEKNYVTYVTIEY